MTRLDGPVSLTADRQDARCKKKKRTLRCLTSWRMPRGEPQILPREESSLAGGGGAASRRVGTRARLQWLA